LEGLLENGYQSGLDPALEAAMLGQSTKLIKIIKDNDTAIMVAAENGSRNILKYIIKKGANVNYQNTKGETALIRAVMKGAKDNVKILIENNADINLKDKNGNTAMDYAQKSNYNEIVKILKNAK